MGYIGQRMLRLEVPGQEKKRKAKEKIYRCCYGG